MNKICLEIETDLLIICCFYSLSSGLPIAIGAVRNVGNGRLVPPFSTCFTSDALDSYRSSQRERRSIVSTYLTHTTKTGSKERENIEGIN